MPSRPRRRVGARAAEPATPSPDTGDTVAGVDRMNRRHVALLRGINVGRAKRVAMADLRALVTALGYTDVRTLLNSGNVVFTVPAGSRGDPAARIEQAMAKRLGVTARVTVLTASELDAAVTKNPLAAEADDPSRLLVSVLADPKDVAKLRPLTREDWTPEVLALGPRVAYLWMPAGVMQSKVAKALDRVLGDAVTARNWSTMRKLHDLVHRPDEGK
jgi:uncharacterized protein (DUF1697 family)